MAPVNWAQPETRGRGSPEGDVQSNFSRPRSWVESAFESTNRSYPAHNEWPRDIFIFVSLLNCVMQASVDSLIFQNWHLTALPTQWQKCVKSAQSVHPAWQWHGMGKQLNLASNGSTVLIIFAVWIHPERHCDPSFKTMASVIETESCLRCRMGLPWWVFFFHVNRF